MHGAITRAGAIVAPCPGKPRRWARVLADHGTLPLSEVPGARAELAEAGPPLNVLRSSDAMST
jgi:gamma-glutamyltranspeptidase